MARGGRVGRADDGDDAGLNGYERAEAAELGLVFELLELGLPVVGWRERGGGWRSTFCVDRCARAAARAT